MCHLFCTTDDRTQSGHIGKGMNAESHNLIHSDEGCCHPEFQSDLDTNQQSTTKCSTAVALCPELEGSLRIMCLLSLERSTLTPGSKNITRVAP